MKNLKQILFFLAALFLGSMLNGAILHISNQIIPPPEGFDMNNPDELALAMKHMQVRHFISPFFAHALGTLLSAVLFYYFSKSQKKLPMLFNWFHVFCCWVVYGYYFAIASVVYCHRSWIGLFSNGLYWLSNRKKKRILELNYEAVFFNPLSFDSIEFMQSFSWKRHSTMPAFKN